MCYGGPEGQITVENNYIYTYLKETKREGVNVKDDLSNKT